jgi:hypothetical protein
MDALNRDAISITNACIEEFALELEFLISDDKVRETFLKRWKAAIEEDVRDSVETTGLFVAPPVPRITPHAARSALIEQLKKAPPSTERPLLGKSFKEQPIVTITPQPVIHIDNPKPSKEWVLTDENAIELSRKYPVRIYGTRAGPDAKRKRGSQGYGTIGFSNKTGSYFLILNDGYMQLSNGMIECFFKRAEITMSGFFID